MHGLTLFLLLQVVSVSLSLNPKNQEDFKVNNGYAMTNFLEQLELPESIYSFNIMREISNDTTLDRFDQYIDHIKESGIKLIQNSGRQIILDVKWNNNIIQDVETAINNYKKKIENYATVNYISVLKSKLAVDGLYMFLDMLHTAYRYLFREQRRILDRLPERSITINSTSIDILNLHRIIYNQTTNFKKDEMFYICYNYRVCKPHSTFSTNLHTFVSEVLALQDVEFKKFMELLGEIISYDEDFSELTSENEDILVQVSRIFSSPLSIKESMEVLRALLTHRYKIIHISNLKRKRRVQAARILLDIIEKTLSFNHDEEIPIPIDATIKAIKNWNTAVLRNEEGYESNDEISDFLNGIFRALNKNGDSYIPSLINTLLTGKIKEDENYRELFSNGFKNVFAVEETL